MEDVQLFDQELDTRGDQRVGQTVGVDLDEGWHDEEVAREGEDVFEVVRGVDHGSHGVAEDARVFGVEGETAVEDVHQELDVIGAGEVSRHGLQHSSNKPDPV